MKKSRFRLRIDVDQLATYAARFEVTSDLPVQRFLDAAGSWRELGLEDLLAIVAWKSPRPLPRARENTDEFVRAVSAAAFGSSNEQFRIEVLTLLGGVAWPTASVILHLCDSEPYPILDYRALWTAGATRPAKYDFKLWWEYVQFFRGLMARTRLSARELDRALWQYSKEHQPRSP